MIKTDYKVGDRVVVIRDTEYPERTAMKILTVRENNGTMLEHTWNLYFEETLGLDYKHVRPLTKLDKALK